MGDGNGPIRTCTGCRARRRQDELLRIAHRPDGTIGIGRGAGRGAYVCPETECIDRALDSGALARALRYAGTLPNELRARLLERGKEGTHGKAQGA